MKLVKCEIELAKSATISINENKDSTFLLALKVTENGTKVENPSLTYNGDCLTKCDCAFGDYDVYQLSCDSSKTYGVEINGITRGKIQLMAIDSNVVDVDYTSSAVEPEPEEPKHKFIIGPNVPAKTMMRFNIDQEWYEYYPGQIIEPCNYAEFTGNARMVKSNGGEPYIVVGGCPIEDDVMLIEFPKGYKVQTQADFNPVYASINDNPTMTSITSLRTYKNVVCIYFDMPIKWSPVSGPSSTMTLPAMTKLELKSDINIYNAD